MIPTSQDNPDGLHQRYKIAMANGAPCDPRAAYFVLRLDGLGDDPGHIAACRAAARAYCDHAPPHLERVAAELRRLVEHFESGML